ncbi:HAAS signaling domain-containing protein [Actinoplanes sp. CA-015351]|uniref:HAAS signaling domain-containing protein n=1 Tax=Actinoplanes sp. CA-015351 TaxID=3239897 RepID=UPI003D964F11
MTTAPLAHADTLVLDYLAALWVAGEDLSPEARDELMSTVTGYIALRRDLADDPARVIVRLGPPEQLADAVRRGGMPTHLRLPAPGPTPQPPAPGVNGPGVNGPGPNGPARPAASMRPAVGGPAGGAEHAAIALLLAGAFVLPVVGPGAGMLIATGSPSWSPAQKAAGWVLTTGSVAGALLTALVVAGFSSQLGLLVLYLGASAGSVIAGLTLLAGLKRPRVQAFEP